MSKIKSGTSKFRANKRYIVCALAGVLMLCVTAGLLWLNYPDGKGEPGYTEGIVFSLNGTNRYGQANSSMYLEKQGEAYASVINYSGSAEHIVIPDTYEGLPVRAISEDAFKGTDIVSVRIPDTVVTIESEAFRSCSVLERVAMSDAAKEIFAGAFADCSLLSEISLPEGIKVISSRLFFNCCSLISINIPGSIELIADDAFTGSGAEHCVGYASLENYPAGEDNSDLVIGEPFRMIKPYGFSYSKNNESELACNLERVTVSGNVRIIGHNAFAGCGNLREVRICEGAVTIAEDAFASCYELDMLVIPDSVVNIYDDLGLTEEGKVINDKLVIYCSDDSFARSWAEEYGFATAPLNRISHK